MDDVDARTVKVFISPRFRGEDKGDGGIRRVVEAQYKWLPTYEIDIADTPEDADVIALHAGTWIDTNKPTVAHCHGLYWSDYKWPRWALAVNKDVLRTLKQSDACTAPSKWVAHSLSRMGWLEPVIAYHGIDPIEWPAQTKYGEYVLWNKTRVDAICDPKPVDLLAARAKEHKFVTTFGTQTDNVLVTGTLPYQEAKQYVQHAGVYLATAKETFGIGTLEAMASGVPVLAWDWGGQSEFVIHKQHGYLAKPGDYADLQAGLEYCFEYREFLGNNAREYALQEFNWRKRIKVYADLYEDLYSNLRSRPYVSVVIPYYNLPDTIERAVMSAAANDPGEIIVVDDASPEPLPASITVRQDVKIIRNETNQYLAEALNTGIAAANGKYIVPLDADNELAPNSLSILAGELEKDAGLDIAYGRMDVIHNERRFTSQWPPEIARLSEQLRHRNQISSTAMYRRRVWERTGGYRRRCHTAEDADFWSRALALGFTGRRVTDATTLIYHDRSDSMSHTQKDWAWHYWYKWADDPVTKSPLAGGDALYTYENPVISVVIPVGPGHERLVLDALDSLQNQSLPLWEAVVVNDTGHDIPWLPPWVRVATTETHGAGSARNTGINFARGEYILFLDADDYLHSDALSYMHEAMRQGAGFVYSDWFVAETGEYKQAPDFDPELVLHQLPYPVTCLYKREDLLSHDILFDGQFDHKGWEDWDFQLQVIAREGLCGSRVAAPLFHYRMSTGTLREAAYLKRDDMKQEILAKWGDYIAGKVPNMAGRCGACGGGRTFSVSRIQTSSSNGAPEAAPMPTVTLEYLSDEGGTRWFVGRVSGLRYRFGTDPDHRVKNVDARDAEYLLSLDYFKLRETAPATSGAFEAMQAAGPPR